LVTTLEGTACLIISFILPKSAGNTWFLGYSFQRIVMILGLLAVNLVCVWLTVSIWRKPKWDNAANTLLDQLAADGLKSTCVLTILSGCLMIAVYLLVMWGFTTDVYYQGYLLRISPFLILWGLVTTQLIIALLSRVSPLVRTHWLWSLVLAVVVTLLHEWMVFRYHRLNNLSLILVMFLTTLVAQALFRRSFLMTKKHQLGWITAVAAIGLFLYFELSFIPKKFLVYQESIFLLGPTILAGLVLSAHYLYEVKDRLISSAWSRSLLYLLLLTGFIYLGNVYFQIGMTHSEQINTTYAPHDDEESFMEFAKSVRLTNFKDTGSRNQMPVYPYIQALFYDPEIGMDEFFARGKLVNIILSLVSLVILYLAVKTNFPLLQTITLILMIAFGLYVFKSGYFLVELPYYTIIALAFLMVNLALIKPSIKLGVGIGILLGIGHLTKASVLPMFLLFIGIIILLELFHLFRKVKVKTDDTESDKPPLKTRVAALSLAVLCFLALISPYIIESKIKFGRFFYNVNSTFYMWYDSWEEAIEGTIAFDDQKGWPDMPPDDIPGPGKYFREHTLTDVLARLKYGLNWQLQNIRYQYSFFNYPILIFLYGVVLLFLDIQKTQAVVRKYLPLTAFSLCFFLGYFAIYVWYSPLANSPRFLYSLYIPFLLSIFAIGMALESEISSPLIRITNITVLGMTIIDIWYIFSQGPFNRNFGS